jgi:glutathione S-transferase
VLRLITIPISHYCEKARWALDRAGIAYREERHVQGIHRMVARRAGGGKTVPVLVTPEGVIAESAEILEWVDERTPAQHRLYPADADERREVDELCRRFDDVLGPRARRLIYVHVLPERDSVLRFNNAGVPRWEDRTLRLGWAVAEPYMRRELAISPGIEAEDERAVWGELDFAAGLLSRGHPHFGGERLTAADLTFAALCAALILPPEYGTPLPQPDVLPPHTRELVERARAHPAGAYALELFVERRRERVA